MTEYKLTRGTDELIGGDEDDVFTGVGTINTLNASDIISGGRGTDTLRFTEITTTRLSFGSDRLVGISSIERLDLSGVDGGISFALDAATIGQADGGKLTVAFGDNPMIFGVTSIDDGDTVFLAGTGEVTLRNFEGQRINVADGFNGTIIGASSDDVLTGGSGNDTLKGGLGRDTLTGGAGNDVLDGGDGVDLIVSGGGSDTVTGGAGADIFRVGAGSTTITDFDVEFHLERIDLRGVASATDFSKLTVTDSAAGALVKVADTSVLLKGVKADQVSAGNFIYSGQTDTSVISVTAGTAQSIIQRLINEAPPGTTIKLEAGVFEFDTTLNIRRNGITVEGAGSDKTIIRSLIPDTEVAPTIRVQGSLPEYKFADLTETALKGSKTITLTTTANVKVGDVLYIGQDNDEAFFAETGNTGITVPDPSSPESAGPLREMLSRIVSIDGNTVTLAEPLPYTFEGGKGWAGKPSLLKDVTVGGFRIETNLPTAPDSTNFNNTRAAWESVATVILKSVVDSTIYDVTTVNNNSSAFVFSRSYNITADHISALGSYNKGNSGNGYAYVLEEVFASNFTHLTDKDMRHSVLFSAWNAEHYNNIQVDFTNRDINFHGSPDSENTILVDHSEAYYLPGRASWPTVGPGTFPIHPHSTIEANDVRFRYLRSTERDETVHAALTGGDIDAAGGDDIIYGARSADLLSGGDGNDQIWGDLGNDRLNGGRGSDILKGGAGNDVLSGDDGADVLDGETGIDTLLGGAGSDLLRLGTGDTGTGGVGADTFVIFGSTTIADFSVADPLEKIDLRKIKAATAFSTLKITQVGADASVVVGGVTVLLKNVKASTLTADDFVFVGDRNLTIAERHTMLPNVHGPFGTVEYVGTAGNDLIETTAAQINTTARVFGNAGTDTLRVVSDNIGIGAEVFARMSSIEVVDVSTATGTVYLDIGAEGVAQANGGLLTIYGGANDIGLNTATVGKAGKVVVETFGTVSLRRSVENVVTVSDRVDGKVLGDSGRDTIIGGARADKLSGGLDDDLIRGGAGNDTIDGGAGDDILDGGLGKDVLIGGEGNDTLRLAGGDIATGGTGSDVFVIGGTAVIADYEAADRYEKIDLRGIKAATSFSALSFKQSGADLLVVVGGVTVVLKNTSRSAINADDFIFVGSTETTLSDLHNKKAIGTLSSGTDKLAGTAGNDIFEATALGLNGTDSVSGGAGTDTLRFISGKVSQTEASLGRLSSVEIIDVTSTSGAPSFQIGAGAVGQADGDRLTLFGGMKDIFLDTSAVGKAGTVVVETFGTVTLRSVVDNAVTVSDKVEGKIVGGGRVDLITGGARADVLTGAGGDDRIVGGAGDDRIDGGTGDDILDGGLGKDVLVGGEGNDTLLLAGGDTATGGTGSDVFVIGGSAVITDFSVTDGYEKIDLRGIKAATSFSALSLKQVGADLQIKAGGTTFFLKNTSQSKIAADDFIFYGSTESTLAGLHSRPAIGTLTSGTDRLVGTAGDDFFEGTALGLNGTDSVNGGAGTDTLRFISGKVSQTEASLGRLSSVEIIDVTQTSGVPSFQIGAGAVGQADGDRLTLFGGMKDLFLDTSAVGKAGTVVVETYGTVTLRSVVDNAVTVSDKVEGKIVGGGRVDLITGGARADVLTGAGGDDRIVGGAGDDRIDGGTGDDILDGGLGKDVLVGGEGNDTLLLAGGDTATGGTGSDVFVIGGSAVITDFSVTDSYEKIDLRGIKAATSFSALSIAQVGADLQIKAGGTTFYLKNTSRSAINADDFIFYGSTESTLAGLHSRPAIGTLTSGTDRLVGTAGDDFFEATALGLNTTDSVSGGAGTDTLRFISGKVSQTEASLSRLSSVEIIDVTQTSGTASFQIGAGAVGQADGDRLTLFGGMKDFFLDTSAVGKAGTVVVETYGTVTLRPVVDNAVTVSDKVEGIVVGGGRVDLITGGAKVDSLTGGEGDDVLDGKGGADLLVGGRHDDTYYVDNARDRVVELKMEGEDTVIASVSYTLAAGQEIETLQLAAGRTKLALTGNEFAQTLVGNAGVNILDGKLGHDVLIGGAGADTFVFSTQPGSTNLDHITDFAVEDTIQLAQSVFAVLAPGKLAEGAFKDLAVAGAKLDADDRIVYNHNTGVLAYDADGSGKGAAVTFAILDNKALLTHADFLVA